MPIRRLRVAGFKSIKRLDLSLRPINVLVGANGSGKSNFLSLFTFLHHLDAGGWRRYVKRNGFANAFFHFGVKNTEAIVLEIGFADYAYHVEFIHDATNDALELDLEIDQEYRLWWDLGGSKRRPAGVMDAPNHREPRIAPAHLETYRVYHFQDAGPTAPFKRACALHDDVPLRPDAANLAAFLYCLREEYPRDYREVVSTIRCIAPFFRDFHLAPKGRNGDEFILLRWRHRDYGGILSANQLSEGTVRFICLAALLLQPEALMPPTIILDEPELGLHPFAIAVATEMIRTLPRGVQIICATQSVKFVDDFNPEDLIVVDQKEGVSIFSRPDVAALEIWLEEFELGDLWDKNLFKGRVE